MILINNLRLEIILPIIGIIFSLYMILRQYYYNSTYKKRMYKEVFNKLGVLDERLHDNVSLNSLAQFRNFRPDLYLKNEINNDAYYYEQMLAIMKKSEKIINDENLIDKIDEINTKHVSSHIIKKYQDLFKKYTSFEIIYNYTSAAGRNSYTENKLFSICFLASELNKKEKLIFSDFMSKKQFEENWIIEKHGNKVINGYQTIIMPGCYIILLFDHPTTVFKNFRSVYVGQSVDVYKRVHNHFTGKGNGDVYADIKNGKYAYVKIIQCEKYELNDLEKELIAYYNATDSYNKTAGGAKNR